MVIFPPKPNEAFFGYSGLIYHVNSCGLCAYFPWGNSGLLLTVGSFIPIWMSFHSFLPTFSYVGHQVHCLGHPDESAVRGFDVSESSTASSGATSLQDRLQPQSDTGYIRLRKPSSDDRGDAVTSDEKRTAYFRSTLQCSICFISFQGLPKLVEHTNIAHSVAHPRIFKSPPCSRPAPTPSYLGDMADEFVISSDLDAEQLITKCGSVSVPWSHKFRFFMK